MAQLIHLFFPLFAAAAAPFRLEPSALATLPAKHEFQKTVVGGLSGVAFHDDELLLISDDRGKIDRPRFYRADLKIDGDRATIRLKSMHVLKGVPGLADGSAVLDPEGIAVDAGGKVLVSSEADTNRKPREQNRLMRFDSTGNFLDEGKFHAAYQPNRTGQQTRGTPNNGGPEGLTVCPEGTVWTAMERPLRQEEDGRKVRFLSWTSKPGGPVAGAEVVYPLDEPVDGEIFRGVSEILCWDRRRFLVLERSLRLQAGSPPRVFGGALFFADCGADTCTKTPLLDLEKDLGKLRGTKPGANFEGLSFGPALADGSRSVLMISDDNFDSRDGTELVIFKVLPVPPPATEKK